MPPLIEKEKCIGCGQCVEICQMDVFFGSRKKEIPLIRYPEECWHCHSCVMACPEEGAISVRVPLPALPYYRSGRL
ncbi:MAG: 4Fe-4S binding protein [Deltaproteobacteria bacterium]|nr:4Fe-4S binding protein [Deltaproteobacteria bacterium]